MPPRQGRTPWPGGSKSLFYALAAIAALGAVATAWTQPLSAWPNRIVILLAYVLMASSILSWKTPLGSWRSLIVAPLVGAVALILPLNPLVQAMAIAVASSLIVVMSLSSSSGELLARSWIPALVVVLVGLVGFVAAVIGGAVLEALIEGIAGPAAAGSGEASGAFLAGLWFVTEFSVLVVTDVLTIRRLRAG